MLFQNLKQQVLRPDNEPAFCSARYFLTASSSPIGREILPPILEGEESAANKAIQENPRLNSQSTSQVGSCQFLELRSPARVLLGQAARGSRRASIAHGVIWSTANTKSSISHA